MVVSPSVLLESLSLLLVQDEKDELGELESLPLTFFFPRPTPPVPTADECLVDFGSSDLPRSGVVLSDVLPVDLLLDAGVQILICLVDDCSLVLLELAPMALFLLTFAESSFLQLSLNESILLPEEPAGGGTFVDAGDTLSTVFCDLSITPN